MHAIGDRDGFKEQIIVPGGLLRQKGSLETAIMSGIRI